MYRRIARILAATTTGATIAALGFTGVSPASGAASPAQAGTILTAITAAHHPGFDRLVFRFRGPLPRQRSARYVSKIIAPSGRPVHIAGSALLQVRFFPAAGHNDAGSVTFGPIRRAFALPNLMQVVAAEDFEAVLVFGAGLARHEPFHLFTLRDPNRVVIDIQTPFRTVRVGDWFLNTRRFRTGIPPDTQRVSRPVIPPSVAFGALQRLFAGPTRAERAQSLRFVASGATGFRNLSIADGVARVQLTGGCRSGGSTFTVANEIGPTLKQVPSVHWVKIYGPFGHTERPSGHSDSIPVCLEP